MPESGNKCGDKSKKLLHESAKQRERVGLLTCLDLPRPSHLYKSKRQWASCGQTFSVRLTAAGTVLDLHQFPCSILSYTLTTV